MSDDARQIKKVELEAEHVPEQHFTRNTDGSVTEQTLPGTVTLYAVFDGGRVPLTQFPGARVTEAIDAAKEAKGSKKADEAEPAPAAEAEAE
jgi:hypothetical protein